MLNSSDLDLPDSVWWFFATQRDAGREGHSESDVMILHKH